MRFEALEWEKQIAFLERLHKTINQEIFKGELKPVWIDIRNLNKGDPKDDCWARYFKEENGHYETMCIDSVTQKVTYPESIFFDHCFVNTLEKKPTQKIQAYYLTAVMLHEMIHQYCAKNGIDDRNHSEQWQQAATDHGLHSVYKDGEIQEESLKGVALWISGLLRIR
ncbi:MAG: hypothetical protein IKZ43_04535 [Acidaminococcaceae bacterium]|nr:hypothetical protein [Acidaminococcaceae bacterium]